MIYPLDKLQTAIASHPEQWRPLVFTNGCFDLLHAGHIRYLQAARKLGRSLVVGLNSDVSVQKLKPQKPGFPPRPLIPEGERAVVLAALKPVDAVVLFSTVTATPLIEALKPEIYVKGGDYTPETLPEYPDVMVYGGQIELIPVEVSISTSGIIDRILRG